MHYILLFFICSENTSFHVNACDKSLIITVKEESTKTCAVNFHLSGISFLPTTTEVLQTSSDHTIHLRLGLKEILGDEHFNEQCTSASNCDASIESLQSSPFYYHCRRCGFMLLDHRLWVLVRFFVYLSHQSTQYDKILHIISCCIMQCSAAGYCGMAYHASSILLLCSLLQTYV